MQWSHLRVHFCQLLAAFNIPQMNAIVMLRSYQLRAIGRKHQTRVAANNDLRSGRREFTSQNSIRPGQRETAMIFPVGEKATDLT